MRYPVLKAREKNKPLSSELYKQTLFHTVLSEIPWVLQKEEEELAEERE